MSGLEGYTLSEEIEFLQEYKDRVIRILDRPGPQRRKVARKAIIESFLQTREYSATAVAVEISPQAVRHVMLQAFRLAKTLAGVYPPKDLNLVGYRARVFALESQAIRGERKAPRKPSLANAAFPELVPMARALRKLRQERNLTQAQVAMEAQLGLEHYQRMESARANPSATALIRLMRVLGVTAYEIFGEKEA